DLVARYTRAFPEVRVSLTEATSDLQIEALLGGKTDAGLIVSAPGVPLHAALAYRALIREPLVVAVPAAWRAAGAPDGVDRRAPDGADPMAPEGANPMAPEGAGVHLRDLLDAPLIIFPRRSAPAFHDIVTGYYAANGAEPR